MKFFQLTRSERIGLFGVLLIFIFVFLFKYFEPQVPIEYISSSVENIKEIDELISLKKSKYKSPSRKKESYSSDRIEVFEKFNPNNVNSSYWEKIGFNARLAIRLERFVNSGFEIKKVDDLKKVYGMKKEWFNLIKDSIILDAPIIDLNSANLECFQSIYGIGEKISNRIINFRNSLGGFYNVNQLRQVYGIDSNLFSDNRFRFKLITKHKKININEVGLKKLIKHPLINKFQGEEIIRVRSVYGVVDDIKLQYIFTSNEWNKVKHYLKWEN